MPIRSDPTTKSVPAMLNAGIPHVVAAAELGIGMQPTQQITLAGAAPHAITFASLVGMNGGRFRTPLDPDYQVYVCGDSAARCDLSTRTLTGFSLAGGSAADVITLLIVGHFGAMVR